MVGRNSQVLERVAAALALTPSLCVILSSDFGHHPKRQGNPCCGRSGVARSRQQMKRQPTDTTRRIEIEIPGPATVTLFFTEFDIDDWCWLSLRRSFGGVIRCAGIPDTERPRHDGEAPQRNLTTET